MVRSWYLSISRQNKSSLSCHVIYSHHSENFRKLFVCFQICVSIHPTGVAVLPFFSEAWPLVNLKPCHTGPPNQLSYPTGAMTNPTQKPTDLMVMICVWYWSHHAAGYHKYNPTPAELTGERLWLCPSAVANRWMLMWRAAEQQWTTFCCCKKELRLPIQLTNICHYAQTQLDDKQEPLLCLTGNQCLIIVKFKLNVWLISVSRCCVKIVALTVMFCFGFGGFKKQQQHLIKMFRHVASQKQSGSSEKWSERGGWKVGGTTSRWLLWSVSYWLLVWELVGFPITDWKSEIKKIILKSLYFHWNKMCVKRSYEACHKFSVFQAFPLNIDPRNRHIICLRSDKYGLIWFPFVFRGQ